MLRPAIWGWACLALVALTASGTPARADFIFGVTATTNLGTGPGHSLPNLTNGQGLSALSLTATHNAESADMWMSDGASQTGWLVFDLQAVYLLDEIVIWNYNSEPNLNRGVKDFNLEASLDGSTYTDVLGSSTLSMGTGSNALPGESFALSGTTARYVRLNIESHYGTGEVPFVGLSEVQFGGELGPQAVPVPPSALLMGLGLAGLGLLARRSRKLAASQSPAS